MPSLPTDDPGFVQDGVWHRGSNEMVRRVRLDEMASRRFAKGVQIPRGSVGIVVVDGAVTEIMEPGFQVAAGWFERLANLATNRLAKKDVYLVDLRPVPLPFTFDGRSGGAVTKYQLVVEARLRKEDRGALLRFLDQALGDRDALSSRELHDHLRRQVEAVIRPALDQLAPSSDMAGVEKSLAGELRTRVGDPLGLYLAVNLQPLTSVISLDLRLGGGASPATKRCVGCGVELASTKKFCSACGISQPVMTQPARSCSKCGAHVKEGKKFCSQCATPFEPGPPLDAPLFTPDGQQVEVDLVVRVQGSATPGLDSQVAPVAMSAVSAALRGSPFAELSTPSGFRGLEQRVTGSVQSSLKALGLTVLDVVVLDVRSKGGEWLLGARAELDRAVKEAYLGREWMEIEAKNLDLKTMTLDMVLRTQRIDREHVLSLDKEQLEDRRRRQELLDQTAGLDVADARRAAERAIGVDSARRQERRAVTSEDHADRLTQAEQGQELGARAAGYSRENRAAEAQFTRETQVAEARHEMSLEKDTAWHEMSLEKDTAQHDAALAREAMTLGSERTRQETEDRSFVARADAEVSGVVGRSKADTTAYTTRTLGEAEVGVARAKQDLELEAEQRRQATQLEKLRAMAELDAKIREDELREKKQQQEHEQRLRDMLRGQSADQMLAMQAGGDSGGAIAAALAEKFKAEAAATGVSSARQQELYERMLAEQKAAQHAVAQAALHAQAQMMQMMQTLGAVTTAAVGGQREAEEARRAAQQRASEQAISGADKAMESMAQVAAAGASRRAAPAPVARPCPVCSAQTSSEDRVCGECGTRLG